jgi:hypothetical protein
MKDINVLAADDDDAHVRQDHHQTPVLGWVVVWQVTNPAAPMSANAA